MTTLRQWTFIRPGLFDGGMCLASSIGDTWTMLFFFHVVDAVNKDEYDILRLPRKDILLDNEDYIM